MFLIYQKCNYCKFSKAPSRQLSVAWSEWPKILYYNYIIIQTLWPCQGFNFTILVLADCCSHQTSFWAQHPPPPIMHFPPKTHFPYQWKKLCMVLPCNWPTCMPSAYTHTPPRLAGTGGRMSSGVNCKHMNNTHERLEYQNLLERKFLQIKNKHFFITDILQTKASSKNVINYTASPLWCEFNYIMKFYSTRKRTEEWDPKSPTNLLY